MLALATAGLLCVAGVAVLFAFDPARHAFYPRCTFHLLTGLECPGCGSLRAVHHLLHGDVAEALRLNALVVGGLPLLAAVLAWQLWPKRPGRVSRATIRPVWLWLMLAVLVLFGVVRNLPVLTSLVP